MYRIGHIALLFILLTIPCFSLPVEIEQAESLKVEYGGTTLLEARSLPPAQVQALKKWFSKPPKKLSITAKGPSVVGLPVKLIVDKKIARRWKSEPKTLAAFFAKRLNLHLGDAVPKWDSAGKVVPLGESRVVSLAPFHNHPGLTVTCDAPDVVQVEELGQGRFRLTGLTRGRASLNVTGSTLSAIPTLPISVKPWAARWGKGPGKFTYWGTISDERVNRSVRRWLSARTLVGATVQIEQLDSEDEGRAYKARATGPGALPVEANFSVSAESRGRSALEPAQFVFLSNHPERLVSDGVLFRRDAPKTPVRFMWHHRNQPGSPERSLVLQLHNPTSIKRRMRMMWYSYGPSPDEIHVGHTAALDYSAAGVEGWGEEIVLPPNATRTVEIRSVKESQTASGMAYIGDLSGSQGPLGITVLASTGGGPLPTEPSISADPGRTAAGVFPSDIVIDASHLLGGPYTYLEFGGEPYEVDIERGYPSYGNFGTVYRARLVLKNPATEPKEAVVGFASGGGAARGVLSLDGVIYDLPMGTTGDGLPVATYTLEPGEVRQVDVELFPQAGSNYPIRIVVRSEFRRLEKEELVPPRKLRTAIP